MAEERSSLVFEDVFETVTVDGKDVVLHFDEEQNRFVMLPVTKETKEALLKDAYEKEYDREECLEYEDIGTVFTLTDRGKEAEYVLTIKDEKKVLVPYTPDIMPEIEKLREEEAEKIREEIRKRREEEMKRYKLISDSTADVIRAGLVGKENIKLFERIPICLLFRVPFFNVLNSDRIPEIAETLDLSETDVKSIIFYSKNLVVNDDAEELHAGTVLTDRELADTGEDCSLLKPAPVMTGTFAIQKYAEFLGKKIPGITTHFVPLVPLDSEFGRDMDVQHSKLVRSHMRLETLINIGLPDIIIRNELRMMQERFAGFMNNSLSHFPAKTRRGEILLSVADVLNKEKCTGEA